MCEQGNSNHLFAELGVFRCVAILGDHRLYGICCFFYNKEIVLEQKIISEKTDEGYYVEVFNDNKIVWTDTFATEEGLNWFIKCCNNGKEFEYFHTS